MSIDKLELEMLDLNNDTFETTFNKVVGNDRKIVDYVEKFGLVYLEEVFKATEGQTDFTLSKGIFEPRTNSLRVSVDNVVQTVNDSYVETWNNTFRFSEPLEDGQVVKATYFEPNTKTRTVYTE